MPVHNKDVLLSSSMRGETVDASLVRRWVRRFQSSDRDVIDKPSAGFQAPPLMKEMKHALISSSNPTGG